MKLLEKGYKMLVCDFDLSLSKTDRTISERTVKAIKNFQSEGGIFGVCTGRALPSLDLIYRDYGLTGFKIAYHGSIVADTDGKIISDTYMTTDEAFFLIELFAPDNDSFVIAYTTDGIFCNKDNERRAYYIKMTRVEVIVRENLKQWISDGNFGVRKILIVDGPEKIKNIMEKASDRIPSDIQASISTPEFIEAVHISSTKGAAVLKLAEAMKISPADIVTVGDSSIDVSMLTCTGCGIAVKNADEETKRQAVFVSDYTCDEDAVFHIIEECAFSENPLYEGKNSLKGG